MTDLRLLVKQTGIDDLMDREGINLKSDLASKCGMGINSLSRYLRNHQEPGKDVIKRLCKALNAQPGDFLEFDPEDDVATAA